MDNMLFSNMTLNPQPLHIDRHFCATETEWGQPLMNSLFTLGLMIGISVNDLTVGTTIANLGMQETRFPHPVFENDTLHASTEIIGKRESVSPRRRDRGIAASVPQSGWQAGGRMQTAGFHQEAAEVKSGRHSGSRYPESSGTFKFSWIRIRLLRRRPGMTGEYDALLLFVPPICQRNSRRA